MVKASEEHLEDLRREKFKIVSAHTSAQKSEELSGIIMDMSNKFEPCQTLLRTEHDNPEYQGCKAEVLKMTKKFLEFKDFNWGMAKRRKYEEGELKLLKELALSIRQIGVNCGF